jgi:hypothetical protein
MAGNKSKGQFTLTGLTDLSGFLKSLDPKRQVEIIKKCVDEASAPIVSAAKANLDGNGSVRTGALKKSLEAIVRTYPNTGTVAAFIGAVRGTYTVATNLKTKRTGPIKLRGNENTTKPVIPANYSHLVEYGHRSVHGGGNLTGAREGPIKGHWNSVNKGKSLRKGTIHTTSYIAPKPFLMPAFNAGKAFAENRIKLGLMKAILAQAKFAASKHSKAA